MILTKDFIAYQLAGANVIVDVSIVPIALRTHQVAKPIWLLETVASCTKLKTHMNTLNI